MKICGSNNSFLSILLSALCIAASCRGQSQPGPGQTVPHHGPAMPVAWCSSFMLMSRPSGGGTYDLWAELPGERGEFLIQPTPFPDKERVGVGQGGSHALSRLIGVADIAVFRTLGKNNRAAFAQTMACEYASQPRTGQKLWQRY